jgi:hypothetical protein
MRELLARLQIEHGEAKGRAFDGLLDALGRDEKSVITTLGRASVAALVHLLTAPAPAVREKAATVVHQLAESGNCEALLVSEGAVPPLIRLAESGSSLVVRKKAVLTLHRLSASPDVAHAIAGHGGARPLIEICQTGDTVSQSAAAGRRSGGKGSQAMGSGGILTGCKTGAVEGDRRRSAAVRATRRRGSGAADRGL